MREIEAYDRGLQRSRIALADEIAKITEVKDHITLEEWKLNELEDTAENVDTAKNYEKSPTAAAS